MNKAFAKDWGKKRTAKGTGDNCKLKKKKGYDNLIVANLFLVNETESKLWAPTSIIHFFSHLERTKYVFHLYGTWDEEMMMNTNEWIKSILPSFPGLYENRNHPHWPEFLAKDLIVGSLGHGLCRTHGLLGSPPCFSYPGFSVWLYQIIWFLLA